MTTLYTISCLVIDIPSTNNIILSALQDNRNLDKMITEYDVQGAEDQDLAVIPNYEEEFFNAKTFLQIASTETGDNL